MTETSNSPYDVQGAFPFDAPVKQKHLWQTDGVKVGRSFESELQRGAAGDAVLFPGDAAANATGPRQPVSGQHNWIPIGPRNVGGRVTCLAVDPTTPATMYAGAASGGVFKSLDGGNSWFPLWHAEAALPLGALAVSPSSASVVWAATGQVRPAGAEIIRGNGVYVSTDSGATWTTPGVPGTAPDLAFSFDAIAPHPTNDQICWAVGPAGVLRTTDQGTTWTQFRATAGTYFSDVAFSLSTANAPILYLARATSTGGESVVIRLDSPDDGDPAIETALAAPANQMQVTPNAGTPFLQRPSRAKLAVSPSNRNVAFIAFADNNGNVFDVLRCRNARVTPANNAAWFRFARHPEWVEEEQMETNICLAVSPANSNHIAFGGMELYTATDANSAADPGGPGGTIAITWNRAQAWDLNVVDPGHHADHHALLFVQRAPAPAPPELWNGNDGGISMSADWSTGNAYPNGGTTFPLPTGVTTWTKRSHGLIAPQMYDLSQSPLVPTMMACGHQDNGVFMTDGGTTWQFVMGADGGFIAFDPDDPYRCYATWQGGVTSVEFPGALPGRLPVAGDVIQVGLWPRVLSQGFLPEDAALFVAETVHDPFDSGRVLMGRTHRLYGLRRGVQGDVWAPEPVGTGVEIQGPLPVGGATARLEVVQSAGARALGFQPALGTDTGGAAGEHSRLVAPWQEPYSFNEGDILSVRVNGGAVQNVTFTSGQSIADLSNASATEVVDEINRQAPGNISAVPCFPARPTAVEIQSTATTAGISITIGGTLFARHGRHALGIEPGTYAAPAGGRATVRIPVFEARGRFQPEFADLGVTPPAAPPTLTVQVGGGAARTVTFSAAGGFADPSSLRVGELVAALRGALSADPVHVHPAVLPKPVRIRGTAGNLTFAGDMLGQLGINAATVPDATASPRWPAALAYFRDFTVTDGNGDVARVRGVAAEFGNPSAVTAAEFAAVLGDAIARAGVDAAVTTPGGNVRIAGTAGNLTFGGVALGVLGVAAGPVASVTASPAWPVDLTSPMQMQITDTAGNAVTVTSNNTTFKNPAAVYADEFHQVVGAAFAGGAPNPVNAAVVFEAGDLGGTPRQFAGEPTEITYSATTPGRVWVGGMSGVLHASDDNGSTWRTIRWPAMAAQDRRVEAIAFHPTAPGTAYVGLYGERKDLTFWAEQEHFLGTGPNDPGFMFRTDDDGLTFTHIGAQIADAGAPPSLVSINALETDPAAPDDVYAGTNIGVFVSHDRGDSWAPLNQGLPNAWVRDLAFEPTTRMLRAGVWGRGVYERHVGPEPSRDVQLYVRANELDMGHDRPAPRGVAPLSALPTNVTGTSSPDIKVTRSAPARFTAAGAFVDGTDMDRWIDHEPITPGEADVFVQVHNRGAFAASGVRLVAMFADASHGPPPLGESFWTDHGAGPLGGTSGDWTVIGDQELEDSAGTGADRVTAEMPRVVRFHVDFPADVAEMDTIGLLLIATCAEDANDAADTDVAKLVDGNRMVAYRESETSHPDDDHLLLLRGVDGRQFSVAPAPTASALQALGWTASVGPVSTTTAGVETYDLRPPAATARGIRLSEPTITLNISIPSTAVNFAGLPNATADELAEHINGELLAAGAPVRCFRFAPPAPAPGHLRLLGRSGAVAAVTGGSLAPVLGFPAAPSAQVIGANLEPYVVAAAPGANTLTLQITPQHDVRFTAADIANLGAATAREVRAVINREARLGQIPVRAEVPRAVLRVRGSLTDVEGPEAALGGAHLADLVAGGTSSVAAGDRDGLFDLLTVHGTDRVTPDTDNFLYLRVANAGNIDATDAQLRLFAVTISGGGEVATAQIGADLALTVPAGGTAIAEATWNPGAGAAGDLRWVLAVANLAGRPLDVPATFPDFAAFHTFAARRRRAAYRTFEVAP